MWPSYTGCRHGLRLSNDDIRGIQSLYGRGGTGGTGTGTGGGSKKFIFAIGIYWKANFTFKSYLETNHPLSYKIKDFQT